MERSKGFRTKSRERLKKKPRKRGMPPLSKVMQEFKVGDRVHILLEPSIHKGMPHPRFKGLTGTVLERRGDSYVIEVRDGKKFKKIISRPEHLKLQM